MSFPVEILAAGTESWWPVVMGALLIFALRVTDMSVDSLRIISMVKGHRLVASLLGMVEAGIFIIAISQVLQPPVHWLQMMGYASGFGVGTYIGTSIAGRFVSHYVMLRVFSRQHGPRILEMLRAKNYRVTAVEGEGMKGPVLVLFTVMERRVAVEAMGLIRRADGDAFVTFEPVERAVGGFVPRLAPWWRPAVDNALPRMVPWWRPTVRR